MEKKNIVIGVLVVIALLIVLALYLRNQEDSWIKDERGVWIKHGNPQETPQAVYEQQELIRYASQLYNYFKASEMVFSSQCLGTMQSNPPYVVDIVHVPRTAADDLPQNQCSKILSGEVTHFIELDKNGEIVRIV